MLSNPGFCHCCRQAVTFTASTDWLRDNYRCETCGSIPRQRHIQMVLDKRFPGWETMDIHESSPTYRHMAQYAAKFSYSAWFPDVERGQTAAHGTRCENLEALTFPDEVFDIFITQDVMEHVFDPEAAIREIHRTLKPGGAHVFTTPKHLSLLETRRRARMNADGSTDYLLPAEYHGSPQGDGRALVTWDFGGDFESLLSQWSGASIETIVTVDRNLGLDGRFNEVFVIRKPI